MRRKRKNDDEDLINDFYHNSSTKYEEDDEQDLTNMCFAVTSEVIGENDAMAPREPNKLRDKSWCTNGYSTWNDSDFKKRVRIQRNTFSYILNIITPHILKKSSNVNPNPISPDRQLALTL